VISVDIGKKRDYTAVAGMEKIQNKWAWPYEDRNDGEPYYRLKFIERLPLDTDYDIQIEAIKWIFGAVVEEYKEKNIKPLVVVDATGCGLVVFDLVRKHIPSTNGIWFHGGKNVTRDGAVYNVPQGDLAMVLQIMMQSERLTYASNIPELETLKKELLNFSYKVNINTGHTHFEAWRERDHDDQVYAVACALWWLDKRYKTMSLESAIKFADMVRSCGYPEGHKWIGDKEESTKEPIIWKD